ncbi:MAG TPA: PilZ domain-containing protein [Nitrospirota bacterium]|nr:PilZ domain-containing protein [Nitrospirota bacterium]
MSNKKQVLIICPTVAHQMYLGVLLNRIWYSPVLAKTPIEGLRLAQSMSFAMILYDGNFASTELQQDITLLRTDPSVKNVPLVVFTTNDNPATTETLLSLGCSAILTMPFDLAMVYGIMARLSGQPRTTPRIPVKLRVEIKEGTTEKTLPCINLSEGGLYLRTLEPLPEGTLLHIKFTLPHDTLPIEVTAEVVRRLSLGSQFDAEPGMGLHFIDMPEDTLLRIRNFVQWEMLGDLDWNANI